MGRQRQPARRAGFRHRPAAAVATASRTTPAKSPGRREAADRDRAEQRRRPRSSAVRRSPPARRRARPARSYSPPGRGAAPAAAAARASCQHRRQPSPPAATEPVPRPNRPGHRAGRGQVALTRPASSRTEDLMHRQAQQHTQHAGGQADHQQLQRIDGGDAPLRQAQHPHQRAGVQMTGREARAAMPTATAASSAASTMTISQELVGPVQRLAHFRAGVLDRLDAHAAQPAGSRSRSRPRRRACRGLAPLALGRGHRCGASSPGWRAGSGPVDARSASAISTRGMADEAGIRKPARRATSAADAQRARPASACRRPSGPGCVEHRVLDPPRRPAGWRRISVGPSARSATCENSPRSRMGAGDRLDRDQPDRAAARVGRTRHAGKPGAGGPLQAHAPCGVVEGRRQGWCWRHRAAPGASSARWRDRSGRRPVGEEADRAQRRHRQRDGHRHQPQLVPAAGSRAARRRARVVTAGGREAERSRGGRAGQWRSWCPTYASARARFGNGCVRVAGTSRAAAMLQSLRHGRFCCPPSICPTVSMIAIEDLAHGPLSRPARWTGDRAPSARPRRGRRWWCRRIPRPASPMVLAGARHPGDPRLGGFPASLKCAAL